MNRNRTKRRERLLSLCVAVTVVLAGCVFADIAVAGDLDGIGGYSIRLKQKDFDGSDNSTGGNFALTPETKSLEDPSAQWSSQVRVAFLPMAALTDWRTYLWWVLR